MLIKTNLLINRYNFICIGVRNLVDFKRDTYRFYKKPGVIDVSEKLVKLREEQLNNFCNELFEFKVVVSDLTTNIPNEKERNLLLNISYYIVNDIELLDYFKEKESLKLNTISKRTKVPIRFLEKWKDYLITYVLIIENTNYKYIQDYLKIVENDGEDEKEYSTEECKFHRGIVIERGRHSCIILTCTGEFYKVFNKENAQLGEEIIEGEENNIVKKTKMILGVLLLVITIAGIILYTIYTSSVSTVIIKSPYSIKFEVNRFNLVHYAYSASDAGRKVINEVEPLDKDIDLVLKETIKYSKENELINNNEVIITVNGKALEYGKLSKTGDYIVENNIKTLINNVGSKHYLYESIINQKEEANEVKKSTK